MPGPPQRNDLRESTWRWDWESIPGAWALVTVMHAWFSVTVPPPSGDGGSMAAVTLAALVGGRTLPSVRSECSGSVDVVITPVPHLTQGVLGAVSWHGWWSEAYQSRP